MTRVWETLEAAADTLRRIVGTALRAHGLTPAQYELLGILEGMRCGCCGEGECRCASSYLCQNAVSQRVATTKGNVSGIVQRLVADGLVSREPNPANRRENAVRITERGRRVLLAARPTVEAAVERCFAPLDAAERSCLETLLRRLGPGAPAPEHALPDAIAAEG